ncbi:MAG: DUF5630 domain-containing protein [Gammaproteobacteria bacterium]|nr:DUF5630 domain-containing protein [Gammaproteobacteria bacterium]
MEEASRESLRSSGSGPVSDKFLQIFFSAVKDEELRKQHLSSKHLTGWSNNWKIMSVELQKNSTVKPVITTDNVHPFFNCALNYCRAKGHNIIVFQYLKILAFSHSNFHAARAAVNICINQLFSEKENANINFKTVIQDGCEIALHAAEKHQTPGYLLSAIMNFFAAQHFTKANKVLALQYYSTCYEHLLMADALEPYSEAQIESCYEGQGIIASNSWGCETIQDLIAHFFKLIDASLLLTQKIQREVASEVRLLIPLLEAVPDQTSGLMMDLN